MMREGTKKEYSDMMLVREWQQQDKKEITVFHVNIKEVDRRSPVSGAFVYPFTLPGDDTCGRMD